ncbi:hypothetical protein [Fimbriiglobus ruber]|nr:hypothetical protein [Fimbriiglobus ruber]
MEESSTYQAILARGEARGRLAEARATLERLGGKRFGPPPATVLAALEAIADLPRLEELTDRILDAHSWNDLISSLRINPAALPALSRRKRAVCAPTVQVSAAHPDPVPGKFPELAVLHFHFPEYS